MGKKEMDIKDNSLSKALKQSNSPADKELYAKIKHNGQKVRNVFPIFLKKTVWMTPEDLKRFAWININLRHESGKVPVSALLKACYPWHASQIAEKKRSNELDN